MVLRSLHALLCCMLGGVVSAQQASVSYYGNSCDLPGGPPPLLRATGTPQIGGSFLVRYTGPNGQTPVSEDHPFLIVGTQPLNLAIPQFSNLQPAGCELLVTPDVVFPMPWNGSRFDDQLNVAIPAFSGFAGASAYLQFICFYSSCRPNCTLLLLRTSNGIQATIGS